MRLAKRMEAKEFSTYLLPDDSSILKEIMNSNKTNHVLTKHRVLQMIQPDKGSQDQGQQHQHQHQHQHQQQQLVEQQLQLLLRVRNPKNDYNNVAYSATSGTIPSRFYPCTISDQEHILMEDAFVYVGPPADVEHQRLSQLLLQKQAWTAIVSVKAYITSQCNICTSSSGSSGNHTAGSSPTNTAATTSSSSTHIHSTSNDLEEKKKPFVCVTSFDVIELLDSSMTSVKQKQTKQEKKKEKEYDTDMSVYDRLTDLSSLSHRTPRFKVTSGSIGSFVLQDVGFYTDEELAGLQTCHVVFQKRPANVKDLEMVSSFLSNHNAMVTISEKASGSSSSSSFSPYFAALKEFSEVQNKRQNASLVTNSGKEDVARSQLVERNYALTLSLVLEHARDSSRPKLNIETLCRWHSVLGSDGLMKDAGVIRKKQVRAGWTTFCHFSIVESELGNLLMGLENLERRFLMGMVQTNVAMGYGSKEKRTCLEGYGPILFAAVAMFGVVDIHPFSDGNGRLSRLVANWALARAGFPFTINLFATPLQRQRYVTATEMTRRNTNLTARGVVPLEILSTVRRHVGPFKPLFDLLLSVSVKAITECRKLIDDRDRLHLEEEELRAARRCRERAAAGSCLICLEDGPNIATLCCGKAVHINCIAQWLSNNRTCPQCRSDLPSLTPAIVRPAVGVIRGFNHPEITITTDDTTSTHANDDEVDDTTSTHIEDANDTTSTSVEKVDDTMSTNLAEEVDDTTSTQEVDDTTSTQEVDDTTSDDTMSTQEVDDTTLTQEVDDTTSTQEVDDTTSTHFEEVDDTMSIYAEVVDDTTSTNQETTIDDDTSMDDTSTTDVGQQHPRLCGHASCSNRAAMDCSNNCCGRCCQMFGYYSCDRHNC